MGKLKWNTEPMIIVQSNYIGENLYDAPREYLVSAWWAQYQILRNTFDWHSYLKKFIKIMLDTGVWRDLLTTKLLKSYLECGGNKDLAVMVYRICYTDSYEALKLYEDITKVAEFGDKK